MAKGIQFNHPGGDVVAFKVQIDAVSKEEIVPVAEFIRPAGDPTLYALDMSVRPAWAGLDGEYNVDVIAIDDAGNAAPEVTVARVPFDFLRPDPVSNLRAWP